MNDYRRLNKKRLPVQKILILILSVLIGAVLGAGTVGKVTGEAIKKAKNMSDKHLALFLMMNQWVRIKQKGKKLVSYFENKGYKRIAIYGMSYAVETLIDELKDSGVTVAYGIDRKSDLSYADVDIVSIDANLKPVDAVVVTAITFFDELEEMLSEKIDCPIISLEDILYKV